MYSQLSVLSKLCIMNSLLHFLLLFQFCRSLRNISLGDCILCSGVDESYLSNHESSHKPFESESSQSHLNFFRVESESSHDLVESSQSWVTKSVESFRVTSLPTRVNVESNEIKHCHYYYFFFHFFVLWTKMKWKFLFFQMKFCFCKTSLCQMQLNIVRMTLTSRSLNIMRSEFLKQKKS